MARKLSAKDIHVGPISEADARSACQRLHYSGKGAMNPQLNLGVFLKDKLEGVMQFGPPIQRSTTIRLVEGTGWNDFLELNRMAFSELLPRNSESRALSVAMRLIRQHYPHIDWIISFADGTQCGDGTIYRAAGFILTGIKKNSTLWEMPDGYVFADIGLRAKGTKLRERVGYVVGERWGDFVKRTGARPLQGFQLRYMRFLNPEARARLTVEELPFSEIEAQGAGMYKGKRRGKQAMAGPPAQRQGSADHHAPDHR